jgi:hypothetical protein
MAISSAIATASVQEAPARASPFLERRDTQQTPQPNELAMRIEIAMQSASTN